MSFDNASLLAAPSFLVNFKPSAMALSRLPAELLETIITHGVPEGFESLAVTCRRLYALCQPYIQRHNPLRSKFDHFTYDDEFKDSWSSIGTAFDLIARIAAEPLVARYVRDVDLRNDSLFMRGRPPELDQDLHYGQAVFTLFTNSSYLKQAGLDWLEYYVEVEKDLQAARYSQHATAFLLTLLPNVKNLSLPKRWKPCLATDKLIGAVVCKAKQPHLPDESPSRAQVTSLGPWASLASEKGCKLACASPFLALPRIRSFFGRSCVAIGGSGHTSMASKNPYSGFATTLETVRFVNCCIDEFSIADFLQNTPRLKTLTYRHATKRNRGHQDWDLCKFVTAVEREVGSHLEELSVCIHKLCGSIFPGRISMRGFQRLRKLELPLETARCNITAAAACLAATPPNQSPVVGHGLTDRQELEEVQSLISDLVPASVSQLSLVSSGMHDDDAKALDLMFRDFAARRESTLPALEEIILTCLNSAGDAYKEQCTRVLAETEKAGLMLDLKSSLAFATFKWDGEWGPCLLFPLSLR